MWSAWPKRILEERRFIFSDIILAQLIWLSALVLRQSRNIRSLNLIIFLGACRACVCLPALHKII